MCKILEPDFDADFNDSLRNSERRGASKALAPRVARMAAPTSTLQALDQTMSGSLTAHASDRAKQRSVTPLVLELLTEFGGFHRSHHKDVYMFDKRSRKQIRAEVGPEVYRSIERKFNAYAVVADDGAIVTIGRRGRRFRK